MAKCSGQNLVIIKRRDFQFSTEKCGTKLSAFKSTGRLGHFQPEEAKRDVA